ncbi:MAG: WecB/TagA/CpsF family glycosyltransferase [Actinomycetota bacterium]
MINAETLDPVVDAILGPQQDATDLLPVVVTPNVDIVVHLDRNQDRAEGEVFRQARYCLPDGQPIVWMSRLLGRPLKARLAGSDLFARLWPLVVEDHVATVVVASSEEIATTLAAELPAAGFVVPPMFDADDQATIDRIAAEVLEACREVRPQLVLVGIGNPKDARIIAAVLERWDDTSYPMPVIMGLGASFALYLSLVKRAPDWMQQRGLEWFHRFLQEPRRLFHRYFVRDLAFLPITVGEWRRVRSSR